MKKTQSISVGAIHELPLHDNGLAGAWAVDRLSSLVVSLHLVKVEMLNQASGFRFFFFFFEFTTPPRGPGRALTS
jgi:hypothetical protein